MVGKIFGSNWFYTRLFSWYHGGMNTTNITLQKNGDSEIVVGPDMPMTEVGFAIEVAISNLLGRAVTRFACERRRENNGACRLEFQNENRAALPIPMQISKVTSIGYAVQHGLFPKNILPADLYQQEQPGFVSEGQHKHGISSKPSPRWAAGKTVSVLDFEDFDPNATVAVICFGLADMMTGFFNLGVRNIRWQGSLKKTQLMIQHDLTDEQIRRYMVSSQDYPLNKTVSELK